MFVCPHQNAETPSCLLLRHFQSPRVWLQAVIFWGNKLKLAGSWWESLLLQRPKCQGDLFYFIYFFKYMDSCWGQLIASGYKWTCNTKISTHTSKIYLCKLANLVDRAALTGYCFFFFVWLLSRAQTFTIIMATICLVSETLCFPCMHCNMNPLLPRLVWT